MAARRSELVSYTENAGATFGDRALLDSVRRYLGVSAPVGAQLGWLSRTTRGLTDVIDRLRRREPPFAHPYYWGAFIYTGF
jgi:CHAT domain-containing protein